ncbi:MAG: tetratricopeptide repeat protein [Sorangiineae bacterium]|nr:tetratricopeptide repeat protein [Polyangiaceae bacterium]MEB2322476.1 tetratricopeptide repeat protein [Sorangiineae bacterium]
MKRKRAENAESLLRDAEWARMRGLGARDLVPMLERVLRVADARSALALVATRHLAEALVPRAPWRAARLARRVIAESPDDGRAWGILGLAYTALGHLRLALRAQRRALHLAPDCASTAHNLGHLLDVAFETPDAALGYLARAYRGLPDQPEVAASYAHALARCGRADEARRVLARALDGDEERLESLLSGWSAEPPAREAETERGTGDDQRRSEGR